MQVSALLHTNTDCSRLGLLQRKMPFETSWCPNKTVGFPSLTQLVEELTEAHSGLSALQSIPGKPKRDSSHLFTLFIQFVATAQSVSLFLMPSAVIQLNRRRVQSATLSPSCIWHLPGGYDVVPADVQGRGWEANQRPSTAAIIHVLKQISKNQDKVTQFNYR